MNGASDYSRMQPLVTELRVALTEDARRQLAALGLSANGIGAPPGGRSLSVEEAHAREVVLAVLDAGRHAGISYAESLDGYLDAVAFTLLDRLVAFRCLEERGLLLMDGQPETLVRTDPARGVPSIIWRVRAEQPGFDARSVAREAYRRAGAAMTERVKLLFDPDDEPSAIFPTLPVWQRALEALNDPAIPVETWATDELMGWVYQYWNAVEKRRLFEAVLGSKRIGNSRDVAVASCTYTPRYIVDYLVQNTLGAIWVEMHPDSKLPDTWPYYVRAPEGNAPAERAPKRVRDLTLIDPCVGSGHFLVRAFELFAQLYAEEGIEDPAQVPALILEHNLFGADIDRRAVQIAALALYLKGCERAGTDFRPRQLNLVACDIAIPPDPPDDFLASLDEPELKELARSLWTGLAGIRTFGSLLHPERAVNETFAMLKSKSKGTLWETETDWGARRKHFIAELRTAFTGAANETDLSQHLFGEEASRGLTALEVLGGRYDVVVTNPPYVGFRKMDPDLRAFLGHEYPEATQDLYVAFILRSREFVDVWGCLGIITPQSWLTSTRTRPVRQTLANHWPRTVVGLGQGVFADAALVFAGLFTWSHRKDEHRYLRTARVSAPPFDSTLRLLVTRDALQVWPLSTLTAIEAIPFLPDAPPQLIERMGTGRSIRQIFDLVDGYWGGDNEQTTRQIWETAKPVGHGWVAMSGGKGYGRWWLPNDRAVRSDPGLPMGRRWEYGRVAGGKLSTREEGELSTHLAGVVGLYPRRGVSAAAIESAGAVLNSRIGNLYLRSLVSGLNFNPGYCAQIPVPDLVDATYVPGLVRIAVYLARVEHSTRYSDDPASDSSQTERTRCGSIRLSAEACIDGLLAEAYATSPDVLDDFIPAPAGWNPLIVGYDALPEPPAGIDIPDGLTDFLASLEHHQLAAAELAAVKARLLAMYEAGPGAKEEVEEPTAKRGDEEEAAGAALGARIPIPTETFLEELSVKLELHPISVHWLLEELRAEGVVSPPLRKAELEEYLDVTLVRMLGYRWPEQDAYEAEHGPILDPDLMDADGIIPLVPCGDERTAEQRVTDRLVRAFGEDGAEAFLRDVRKYLKRDLGAWIAKDFFKVHTKRFKNRPIAWHLRSPEGHFEALVLYHRLSRETLAKLRVTYAGDRLARLRADQTRARERKDDRAVSDLQLAIEDVEAFRSTLEAIERGSELKHRIRCRWKNETESGRPGPYAPDIDDGVKVNIRPFQESGLLPTKVISKW